MSETARAFLAVGILWALLFVPAAEAEVFRWTDEEGRLHFTQRLDQVPVRYRLEAARGAVEKPESSGNVQIYDSDARPASSRPAAPARTRARARTGRDGEIQIPFVRQGSLMRVEARVNDRVVVPFLVDSGASGVSLPATYADQLGIRVGRDTQYVRVSTANGIVARPLVRLSSVQLEGARVEGLRATINPSMEVGLLGGDFFNNFIYRVDAAAGVITLVANDHMRAGMGEGEWRQRFHHTRSLIERIDAALGKSDIRRGERERLEARRTELVDSLEELEREANSLDVPFTWRQ